MIKVSEWKRKEKSEYQPIVWINPVHGFIYRLKLLMLCLHRGLSRKYSFRLGTEIKEAKKFDELIFEYIHENKKIYRLLQAKHELDESNKITVDKLLADPKGDYSLVKYFYSFQACKEDKYFKNGIIKDVIICTNIDFDFDDLNKLEIEITKVKEKDDILDINCNGKVRKRYKFTNSIVNKLKSQIKPTYTEGDIECFVNHLVFAVNQPNEEELGQIVKNEIGREMDFINSENAYNKVLDRMVDLTFVKGNSVFVSHEEGKKLFTILKEEIPIWFNIWEPTISFTGRFEYLKKIDEILTNKSQVCISGIGGVGKTELVRKYIADYGHKYNNQIVWINADSYESAVESFRQLASDKLNISLNNSDGTGKHLSSIIRDVYQFLSKDKILFVFDNAEKFKCKDESDCGIDQFLPHLPSNFIKPNVIVISQNQNSPKSFVTIVLEPLSSDETRELLEKMLSFENDKEKKLIDELGKKLQYLPLALQQAIAYINMERGKLALVGANFEISSYLKRLSTLALETLGYEFSEHDYSYYNKSIFATLTITFETLKQKENVQDTLDILNIISYFLPDNIPVDLLLIFSPDKEKLSSAVGLLKQYSLVSVQHKTISVHRLVQQVTRIQLQKENKEVAFLRRAFKLLDGNNINFRNVDHVVSMWTFASKKFELLEEYVRIFHHISRVLRSCGRIQKAHSIGLQISSFLNEVPQNNIDIQRGLMAVQHNDAMILLQKGEYKVALEQLQNLYGLEKDFLGSPDNRSLVITSVAQALIRLGRYKEALAIYDEILDANRNHFGEKHPSILQVKHDISVILSERGEHQEALSILQEIYRMQKENLGDDHERTLRTRSEIASILGKLNKFEESLKILEEVCDDQVDTLPENHPDILVTKFNIATTLALLQKYSPAMKIYQELLDVQKENLGETHLEAIDININIANILNEQGEYEKALDIFVSAFNKQKMNLGPMHPATLNTQDAIANIFKSQENYEEAIKVYEDLLDKQRRAFGTNHPHILETRRSIVKILFEQKKYDEALDLCLESIRDAEKVYGKNHTETLNDKINLGTLYCNAKRFKKSLEILMQVLAVQKTFLTQDHVDCQQTIKRITQVLKERGKYDPNENIDSCLIQLRQLLKRDFDIDAKDKEGRTALHHALDAVDERGVEQLLQQGAEVVVVSNKGDTPLHIAVLRGQKRIVKMLLQKVKPARLNDFVDAKTKLSGTTAIHVASEFGHFGIVKCLLRSHATFCPKNKDGKTPLDLSTDVEITKFFKMIHELFEGLTILDAKDVVEKLKKLSGEELLAVLNTRNDQGSTLAQVAILSKQRQVAAEILKMVQKLN